jgi:glycosyltransferase involved in cell wall biosynthesis
MTNGDPLVSIIVRTKNRPKLLRRALRSVADQDYRPIEVVLVNDGEPLPDSADVAALPGDVILKEVDNGQKGRTAAANAGVTHASGQYVCFLDDDDLLYRDHVSTLVRCLIESDYKVAYTETSFVHTEYDPERQEVTETEREPAPTADFSRESLLFYNYIPFMCLMFDRRVITEAGGFDETFHLCEDWDLTIRISGTHPFHHIPKITSDYNLWSRNLQSIRNDAQLLLYRRKIFQKHFAELSPDVVSSFIFNGYWMDRTWLENRIRPLGEEIEKARNELREGWIRWDETTKRLAELDRQLREAWQHGQEGWTRWDETNKRLIETEAKLKEAWKQAEEGWPRWDETNKRLIETQADVTNLGAAVVSLERELRQKSDQLQATLTSRSFRLGRALTWPARKLRAFMHPSGKG